MEESSEQAANRRDPLSGRFLPGMSGNPGGRPKGVLSEALRRRLGDSPELVAEVADELLGLILRRGRGRASPAVRLAAIEALRDTTEGKPRQAMELDWAYEPALVDLVADLRDAMRATNGEIEDGEAAAYLPPDAAS